MCRLSRGKPRALGARALPGRWSAVLQNRPFGKVHPRRCRGVGASPARSFDERGAAKMRHSSATSCVNLGLPPPEWVSLHQALLIRSEAWTPIPENVFRLIASLPPPDDLAEKRRLIIELATRRLLHRGELWHMLRVCADSRSATGVKLASKYQISSEFWEAKNVCFERSEVRLCEPPAEFNMNRVKGDFFKLAHIEIGSPLFHVGSLRSSLPAIR
jgi:hypothetical protein